MIPKIFRDTFSVCWRFLSIKLNYFAPENIKSEMKLCSEFLLIKLYTRTQDIAAISVMIPAQSPWFWGQFYRRTMMHILLTGGGNWRTRRKNTHREHMQPQSRKGPQNGLFTIFLLLLFVSYRTICRKCLSSLVLVHLQKKWFWETRWCGYKFSTSLLVHLLQIMSTHYSIQSQTGLIDELHICTMYSQKHNVLYNTGKGTYDS